MPLFLRIATVCLELDQVDEARRYIDEVDKLSRATTPRDNSFIASVLILRSRQELHNGYYDTSLATAREAAQLIRDSGVMDDKYISALLRQASISCFRDEDFVSAKDLVREAYNVAQRCPAPFHTAVINVSEAIGFVCTELGEYDVAKEELRRAMLLTERMVGSRHWLYRELQMQQGILTARQGNSEEGYAILKEVAHTHREIAGQENIRYSDILVEMARINIMLGRVDDAARELLDCKLLRDKRLRDGHPKRAEVSYELAVAYIKQKKYSEAEKALAEAEAIYLESIGDTRPAYRRVLAKQVKLYRAMNREADAAKIEKRLGDINAKIPPRGEENGPDKGTSLILTRDNQ